MVLLDSFRLTLGLLGLALVIAVAVLLTRHPSDTDVAKNKPDKSEASEAVPGPVSNASNIPPNDSKSNEPNERQTKRFLADFRTPINFYGKVLDQHGQPVSGASIKLAANDKPMGGHPSEYLRQTDGNGSFSIERIVGLTLAVEVSKPGYQVIPPEYKKVTSSGLFEFGLSPAATPHSDLAAPVIFHLRKPAVAEPLMARKQRNFPIARDGSPLSISLTSNAKDSGRLVVLRCWNDELVVPHTEQKYNWRLEVAVPSGGLVRRDNNLDFEAPDQSYQSSDVIDMSAVLPQNQWRCFAERSYFIRFDDGTYARANMRMRAGGDHFVVWESYLNPTPGSRNLEYDSTKEIKPNY